MLVDRRDKPKDFSKRTEALTYIYVNRRAKNVAYMTEVNNEVDRNDKSITKSHPFKGNPNFTTTVRFAPCRY